jgi:hypothetical protein
MWRNVWTVLLTVTTAQAQLAPQTPSAPINTALDRENEKPHSIQIYEEHNLWRRGTEEKFLLIPEMNPTSSGATIFLGPARPKNGTFEPTELQISPAAGLTVIGVQYPQARRVAFDHDSPKFVAINDRHAHFYLKVRADPTLPLGDHLICGRFTFQQIGQAGLSEMQTLKFKIPVRIVERNIKVKNDGRYYEDVTLLEKIGIILLLPFVFWALPNC